MTWTSIGLDINVLFPMDAFSPYLRLTYSFYDRIWVDGGGSESETFEKNYGVGLGAEFPIAKNIKLFGEFMYASSFDSDEDFWTLGVNVGAKFLF
jgi:hypothetical protein